MPLQAQTPHLEPIRENLLRLEGTDAESGIHYLKLILLLNTAGTTAPAETLPRFTMECREQAGKKSLHWLVRFDGSPDFNFQGPPVPTRQRPHPMPYPRLDLKMRFEGYMRSQEFKRRWEQLPTGELHYLNASMHSPNLDDSHSFLQWLKALPNLRIGYATTGHPAPSERVFPLQAILTELEKSDLCQP